MNKELKNLMVNLFISDNDKYIKTKLKIYGENVNTNFQGKKMPKEILHVNVSH